MICRTRYKSNFASGFLEFVIEGLENCDGTCEPVSITLFCSSGSEPSKTFLLDFVPDFKVEHSIIFDTYCLQDGPWDLALRIADHDFQFQLVVANGDSEQASVLRSSASRLTVEPLFAGPIGSSVFQNFDVYEPIYNPIEVTKSPWAQRRNDFESNGYVVLKGLINKDLCAAASVACARINREGLFGYITGTSERLVSAHNLVDELKHVYEAPEIYEAVSNLLGETSWPAQSLTFINGSEQNAHSDWIHLSTYPLNSMCGVWIALEDVRPLSGELFYYPGSHLRPRISMDELELSKVSTREPDWNEFGLRYGRAVDQMVTSQGFTSEVFMPSAGDVLVWHENLVHGGNKRISNDVSRHSMVLHFFKQSCYAWYDSTGIVANKDFTRTSARTD